MPEFERNTTGFTADVEQYNESTLVKIYRDYVSQADIDREILCTESVQGRGLPVPEYRGSIQYKGKRAILLEYIRGQSMMRVLTSGEIPPEELAKDFAKIHYQMHQCRADGLEEGKIRLERLLKRSERNLGADLTTRCLKLMETLPEGNMLCHNDFHPGNILYNDAKEMIVIDWSDASCGDPFADVARTVQMFDYGPSAASGTLVIPTDKTSPEAIDHMKKSRDIISRFVRRYENKYVELCGLSFSEYEDLVMPWKVIVPASRFDIEWDCNKPAILKMMYQYFMAHPVEQKSYFVFEQGGI